MTSVKTLINDYNIAKRKVNDNKISRKYQTSIETAYQWYKDAQDLVTVTTELRDRLIKIYQNVPTKRTFQLLNSVRWAVYSAMIDTNSAYQIYNPAAGILKTEPLPYPKNKQKQGKLIPIH